MSNPIFVFIGAPEAGLDAECQMVCEFTLRKHTTRPIEITWLTDTQAVTSPLCGWDRSQWATPFSGYRWATPYIAQSDKAIYMDCDTIVRADVGELWDKEFRAGNVALARGGWRYCVTLWNCAPARNVLMPLMHLKKSDGHSKQNAFFREHPSLTCPFGSEWNYLDNEDLGDIGEAKIVHYSGLSTQPHRTLAKTRLQSEGRKHWYKRPSHRHQRPEIKELFMREYAEAVGAGYTPQQYY